MFNELSLRTFKNSYCNWEWIKVINRYIYTTEHAIWSTNILGVKGAHACSYKWFSKMWLHLSNLPNFCCYNFLTMVVVIPLDSYTWPHTQSMHPPPTHPDMHTQTHNTICMSMYSTCTGVEFRKSSEHLQHLKWIDCSFFLMW